MENQRTDMPMDQVQDGNGRDRGKTDRRFSQRQYDFLQQCSDKGEEGIKEWNAWRENNRKDHIELDECDFSWWNLQGVDLGVPQMIREDTGERVFGEVWLRGSHFQRTELDRADLQFAHLEGADMLGTHLGRAALMDARLDRAVAPFSDIRGADVAYAHLEGAKFQRALVDGVTSLWECVIDRETDFEGTAIDSVNIDPATRQLLEYNIRRKNWQRWYKDAEEPIHGGKLFRNRRIRLSTNKALRTAVRSFWAISDYGVSTARIVGTFSVVWFVFAALYWLWPGCIAVNGKVGDLRGFVHALYFSMMAMIGVGDVGPNPDSWLGQVFLIIQVVSGYVLLAALVTRFAVLFSAGGPAGRFGEGRSKKATGK